MAVDNNRWQMNTFVSSMSSDEDSWDEHEKEFKSVSPLRGSKSAPCDPCSGLWRHKRFKAVKCLIDTPRCEVWEALDSKTGYSVAIKLITRSKLSKVGLRVDPLLLEQKVTRACKSLLREGTFLEQIHHPNVIQLVKVLQMGRLGAAMVVEFCPNGDLFGRVDQAGCLGDSEIQIFMVQLLRALEACHTAGIAHRDVKLENCLLTADDVLKLSDFGLASRATPGHEEWTTACGSPEYVAPEALVDGFFDACMSDIWSAGIMLYVMLTGRLPFTARRTTPNWMDGLWTQIRSGKYPPLPDHISKHAVNLVSCLLEVDPKLRLTAAEAMVHPYLELCSTTLPLECPRQAPVDLQNTTMESDLGCFPSPQGPLHRSST